MIDIGKYIVLGMVGWLVLGLIVAVLFGLLCKAQDRPDWPPTRDKP